VSALFFTPKIWTSIRLLQTNGLEVDPSHCSG
jgi:hypothetical protein